MCYIHSPHLQHVMFSSFRGKIFNLTWFERIHKNWPWNQINRVILKLPIFQNILDKSLRRGGLPRDLMVSIFAAKVHAFSALGRKILKFWTKNYFSFGQEHNLALVSLFYRLIVEAEFRPDQSVTISQEDSRCKNIFCHSRYSYIYPPQMQGRACSVSPKKWQTEFLVLIYSASWT